jgi:hypothetical protein
MVNELMDLLVLEKKYQLQKIYDLIEDYCIKNKIEDWKHKVRAILEEKNGTRSLGKYKVTYYGDSTYSIG